MIAFLHIIIILLSHDLLIYNKKKIWLELHIET